MHLPMASRHMRVRPPGTREASAVTTAKDQSRLKERVISGAIAALLVVAAVFALPSVWFIALVTAVLVVPAWEWASLTGAVSAQAKVAFVAALLVLTLVCWWGDLRSVRVISVLVVAGFLYWWYACWRIISYVRQPFASGGGARMLALGLLVLLPCWAALTGLHRIPELGPALVMVLLCLVWATDVGAFFVGRRWGRRKLAAAVSPGKTVAGFWGGMGLGLVVAVVAGSVLGFSGRQWPLFIAICLVTAVFAVVGDLFESMVKRQGNVKDSGNVLPGHGGALDRIDSLTAAAPVFAMGITWLLGRPL